MSWKVTAWAIKQATGSTRRKAVLLALANYADPTGVCWPSQERLAVDTEQSVDSIQRHSQALEKLKLIERELMPKHRGNFGGYRYRLAVPSDEAESTAQVLRSGRAAKRTLTAPHSWRHKPSMGPTSEPSGAASCSSATQDATESRMRAFQAKREAIEVVQNRIAQRLGDDGWLILGDMNDNQRQRLTTLERLGKLDDKTLRNAVLATRAMSPNPLL